MTYSDVFVQTHNKATIIGTDAIEVSPVYGKSTSFSILKSNELLIDEQIDQSAKIFGTDQETIIDTTSILMIVNSSFTLLNINIISDYSSKLSPYYTIWGSSMDYRLMNITNVDFNVSAYLMTVTSSLDIYIQNSMIESLMLLGGIRVIAECDYPEAHIDSSGTFDNLTFYCTYY